MSKGQRKACVSTTALFGVPEGNTQPLAPLVLLFSVTSVG